MLKAGMKRIKLILLGYLLHSTVCAQYAVQLTVKIPAIRLYTFGWRVLITNYSFPKTLFAYPNNPSGFNPLLQFTGILLPLFSTIQEKNMALPGEQRPI